MAEGERSNSTMVAIRPCHVPNATKVLYARRPVMR